MHRRWQCTGICTGWQRRVSCGGRTDAHDRLPFALGGVSGGVGVVIVNAHEQHVGQVAAIGDIRVASDDAAVEGGPLMHTQPQFREPC